MRYEVQVGVYCFAFGYPIAATIYSNGYLSSTGLLLHPCRKSVEHVVWVCFYNCCIGLRVCFYTKAIHLDECSYIVSLNTTYNDSSHFIFLFQDCLNFFRACDLSHKFQIGLTMSVKKLSGVFIEILINLQIKLGRTDVSNMLSHSIHEQNISFHLFRSSLISSAFCNFQHKTSVHTFQVHKPFIFFETQL